MSLALETHRLVRAVERRTTRPIMHRAGVIEDVELVAHERTCACGQVFVGDTELVAIGRYLAHLPKPTPSDGEHRGR